MAKLLNDVAFNHGILYKLLGGGSNRNASYADYIGRARAADMQGGGEGEEAGQLHKRQCLQRSQRSPHVMACLEVKGSWQVRWRWHAAHDTASTF